MGKTLSSLYGQADAYWGSFFNMFDECVPPYLQFYLPLTSLSVTLMMLLQFFWTLIVIDNGFVSDIGFNSSQIFGILTGTLGFILPLRLNSALRKNRACLDNYNAYIGDITAFSWDVIAFNRSSRTESRQIVSNMFDILIALPALTKWHFRGSADLEKLFSKKRNENWQKVKVNLALPLKASTVPTGSAIRFLDTAGGKEVKELIMKINSIKKVADIKNEDTKYISETEACMYKLLDLSKELATLDNPNASVDSGLLRSWERAYGAWGNMGNLAAYKSPTLFVAVLWTALAVYSVLLPFQFVIASKDATQWGPAVKDNGYHGLWMVATIGYFFLGLNVAGSSVGNAFAEGAKGFQTVTASQKNATAALDGIWKARDEVAVSALTANNTTLTSGLGYVGRPRHTSRLSLF